ncbi:MAG: hypothetical protein JO079_05670, partial [Frankiaceae bacterium]|nr:hypothetical protein [Frankiaceae bacterium]
MSNDLFWPGEPDPGREPGDTMPLPGSDGWGGGFTDAPAPARSRRPW